jgi:putative polyhydroxyalkanoate system protein
MASIDIRRKHSRPHAEARKAVERVARHMAERFQIDWGWDGDTLVFERLGVNGEIKVGRKEIHVLAHLSFLLGAIRPTVEREIERYLDEEFG